MFPKPSSVDAHLPLPRRFQNIVSIINLVLILLQLVNAVFLVLLLLGLAIEFILVLLEYQELCSFIELLQLIFLGCQLCHEGRTLPDIAHSPKLKDQPKNLCFFDTIC